jgi:hypothetical protein
MEWMFACVIVIEHDLNDLALLEDEGMGVAAVDCWICSSTSCGEDGVESGNLGCDVGYVVEEGTGVCINMAILQCGDLLEEGGTH